MAAVRTDVFFVLNFLLLLFLALVNNVSCNSCGKTIRRNQTSEKCYTCKNLSHLKCLNDKFVCDEERFFCVDCTPADPEYIINSLDPEISGFIGKKGFKIMHQNINGIEEKLHHIKSFLLDTKNSVHIISFSETHTNNTVTDAQLKIPGYTLERKDRVIEGHGGVSLYIRDDLNYNRRDDLEIEGIEFLWIEFFPKKSKPLLISSCYRPPDNSKYLDRNFVEKFNNILDAITAENKETIMCGDFNCNYKVPGDHSDLKDLVKLHGFSQLIKSYTRITKNSKTLIDLFYTTNKIVITDTLVHTNSISDHGLIGINRKMNCKRYQPKRITARDYSRYNKEDLQNELRNIPWENCLAVDFDKGWDLFKNYVTSTINKHSPLKEKNVRGKPSPWLTREIRQLMHTRDYQLRRFKQTSLDAHWDNYKKLRNTVTKKIRAAKANHIRNVFKKSTDKPSDFWKQIKNCYPTKGTCAPSKFFKINGENVSNPKCISNAFCSFFTKVGSKLMNCKIINYTWKMFDHRDPLKDINRTNATFKFKELTVRETLKILESTNASKAAGPDTSPARIVKDIAPVIAAPLTFLINASLLSGTFPTSEKTAKINPVFKNGDRSNIDNYRPISVLNILSKTIERVVYNQLADYLEENFFLSKHQYGFRRKRSTSDAVTKLTNNIRENMDKGKVTGALFMDLKKAFDTVNHSCLLYKLPYYGILGKEVDWISSYLFHRSQIVNVDGVLSEKEFVTHGVPQGSILGPLLFVLLINDLPIQLNYCNVLMYADDTVIYFSHKSLTEIEKCINSDAEKVFRWMQDNCLILNPKKGKTEFVTFTSRSRNTQINITINNNEIHQPAFYEYLGVIMDSHLNMSSHLQRMYRRVSSRLKMLKKVRHNISPIVAEKIFTSMIQPLIFYCYPVYGGMSDTWRLKFESLFLKAKFIVKNRKKWPTFTIRLKRKIAIDVFKSLHFETDGKYVMINHSINTRGKNCSLRLPSIKSEAGRKLSYYQGAVIFNSLPVSIRKETNFNLFKKLVNNYDF